MALSTARSPRVQEAVRVGDRVRFTWSIYKVQGDVIEDRGAIGAGGRRMLRVAFSLDSADSDPGSRLVTEVPEEYVEIVSSAPSAAVGTSQMADAVTAKRQG